MGDASHGSALQRSCRDGERRVSGDASPSVQTRGFQNAEGCDSTPLMGGRTIQDGERGVFRGIVSLVTSLGHSLYPLASPFESIE